MRARLIFGQNRRQICARALAAKVKLHMRGPGLGLQFGQETGLFGAGTGIMQHKTAPQCMQPVGKGDHWRHPDATGHQQAVAGLFVQRKMVHRARGKHPPPRRKDALQHLRPTPPRIFAQHRNFIDITVGRIA